MIDRNLALQVGPSLLSFRRSFGGFRLQIFL